MQKILLVGLGRIGRNVLSLILSDKFFDNYKICFFDKNRDIDNFVYLLNYDGFDRQKRFVNYNESIHDSISNRNIEFYDFLNETVNFPSGFNFIFETSGSLELIKNKPKVDCPVFISHTPDNNIDKYVIPNINENSVDLNKDKTISMSICDTTAIAPILNNIDQNFKILVGHVTTLHPWLNYQNLLGNPVLSSGIPNSYWKDYSLGRKTTENLIPKSTTAISALKKVLPVIANKITSFSYRIPTPVVSSAIINLKLEKIPLSTDILHKNIIHFYKEIEINNDPLISSDFIQNPSASIINSKYTQLKDDIVSMMIWYDNEFGYSYQYVNSIKKIIQRLENV